MMLTVAGPRSKLPRHSKGRRQRHGTVSPRLPSALLKVTLRGSDRNRARECQLLIPLVPGPGLAGKKQYPSKCGSNALGVVVKLKNRLTLVLKPPTSTQYAARGASSGGWRPGDTLCWKRWGPIQLHQHSLARGTASSSPGKQQRPADWAPAPAGKRQFTDNAQTG